MSQSHRKHVSVQLKRGQHQRYWGSAAFRLMIAFLFLVAQHAPTVMLLRLPAVHPALKWYHWESILKITSAFIYLFISPSIHPSPFSVLLLCFPKMTNILELIEYDPLTAVWNNKASFPHIFPPTASLSCTSVHIKEPYRCQIWGWRNYWSRWEPGERRH